VGQTIDGQGSKEVNLVGGIDISIPYGIATNKNLQL
jgi:hypothetical protein